MLGFDFVIQASELGIRFQAEFGVWGFGAEFEIPLMAFGYIITRPPYTPYSIYLRGTIKCTLGRVGLWY